ncbi:MAG: carbon-nitrogen hydrolase family protein [Chloroflexi bacterium]|nr:carbon-nitrogen hydrolase family protein [Chloroflexota bacterium]
MAHFVKIASVLFASEAHKGQAGALETVLAETRRAMSSLRGYELDLVAFSEGIEAVGQTLADAESPEHPGPLLELYRAFAISEQCHVAGSIKLTEDGHVYNALAFLGPEGQFLGAYYKVNLTIGEIESGLRSGTDAVAIDTNIGRLGGIICFDLNFEDIRRQYRRLRPDILVFASMYHGGFVQRVWAYECQSYFVSALPFIGGGILDPFGDPIALTDCYTSVAMARVNLDRALIHLDYNVDKLPTIARKYLDQVQIVVPPNVGTALIVSQSQERTAMDIVREFELELVDDYFQRSLAANARNRSPIAS